jgi:hypothetical protein
VVSSQSEHAFRYHLKKKDGLVQIFSHFLYGQSYGCFYFTLLSLLAPMILSLILNQNLAILVIIGAVSPIQTSAEKNTFFRDI